VLELPQEQDRIGVLDVLRGIALLGMILVHFHDRSNDAASGIGHLYDRVVPLLFDNRFFTIFGILFGAGFAVQLRRAEASGARMTPRFLRRLLALAAFGFIAEAGFGFNVLIAYAMWGLPLLLVRKWSARALFALLLLSLASPPLYWVGRYGFDALRGGETAIQSDPGLCPGQGIPYMNMRPFFNTPTCKAARAQQTAAQQALRAMVGSTSYREVVAGRVARMETFYTRPFAFLPSNTFSLLLIGVLLLRLGVLERPGEHLRLISGMMLFGVLAWALDNWGPWDQLVPPGSPPAARLLQGLAASVLRSNWLALTYIGGILLLVARSNAWLGRLNAFAVTGRMALTNYMIQIIVIDLAFSNYALGLTLDGTYAPLAALLLFGVELALSRWWLARFRFGPLEWLWRAATYAQLPPMRLERTGEAVPDPV
jgi:uncharacterized protein